jgi:hypothetical protein
VGGPRPEPWCPAPDGASYWPADTSLDIGAECVVCLDRPSGVRFSPCGHRNTCICCFTGLIRTLKTNEPLQCPVCRTTVTGASRDPHTGPWSSRRHVPDAVDGPASERSKEKETERPPHGQRERIAGADDARATGPRGGGARVDQNGTEVRTSGTSPRGPA